MSERKQVLDLLKEISAKLDKLDEVKKAAQEAVKPPSKHLFEQLLECPSCKKGLEEYVRGLIPKPEDFLEKCREGICKIVGEEVKKKLGEGGRREERREERGLFG
ncbi:MAG: hypothetical protein QXK12_08510 [Candidatus Nezhaarchaeales archaeon]